MPDQKGPLGCPRAGMEGDGGGDGGDPPLFGDALAELDAPIAALHAVAAALPLDFPLAERQEEAPATLADAQAASQNVQRDTSSRNRAGGGAGGGAAPRGGDYLTMAWPDARTQPFLAWCEDFFRHLRREDLDALFRGPGWPGGDLADDAAFRWPQLGEHYTTAWAVQDAELAAAVQAAQEVHAAARQKSMALASAARSAAARARAAAGPREPRKAKDGDDLVTSVSPFPPGTDMAELCHVCMDGERCVAQALLCALHFAAASGCDSCCVLTRVCTTPRSTDDNQIVYCDACNVAVHQHCYGVSTVPDGAWFCTPCGAAQGRGGGGGRQAPPPGDGAPASRLRCLLCLRLGGALKPTAGGGGGPDGTAPDGWVHVFCANWTPETYIEDTEAMEPITGLGSIPSERWRMQCTVCRAREGGCIQCAYSTCAAAFHPLCALEAGNTMQIRQRGDRLEYRGFCAKHSGAAAKGRTQKRPGGGPAAPKAGGGDGVEGSDEEGDDDGGEAALGAGGGGCGRPGGAGAGQAVTSPRRGACGWWCWC